MWSQWPWVSSTRVTPRRSHRSSSRSCSLAASISTASPVSVQRSTKTLLSIGPTTTLWISAPVSDQCSVSAMRSRLPSVDASDGGGERRILADAEHRALPGPLEQDGEAGGDGGRADERERDVPVEVLQRATDSRLCARDHVRLGAEARHGHAAELGLQALEREEPREVHLDRAGRGHVPVEH